MENFTALADNSEKVCLLGSEIFYEGLENIDGLVQIKFS
jgi:hypothetical protein